MMIRLTDLAHETVKGSRAIVWWLEAAAVRHQLHYLRVKSVLLVCQSVVYRWWWSDLEFVKKFTRPNFQAKEFYTLKTRKSRLFSLAINSENASLSVIWPSFGYNRTQCVICLTVMKKVYIYVCVNLQNM